jgi:flagellar basal-body rod protein FlgF
VAEADGTVSVAGGAIEGSNVNVVEAMVDMISLARQFEMQMNMMKNVEANDSRATQILNLSS